MMSNQNEFHKSDSGILPFDPIVIVRDVVKQWLLILMISLMVGVGAYIVTDTSFQPVYTTNTTFVVSNRSSSNTVYSNLSSTTTLASVFSELMNSSVLRNTVLEEAGLSDFTGTISSSTIPETNLLNLRVTDSDPRTAFMVTRAIVENHESLTYEVVGNITLEVLQQPKVPTMPSNSVNAGQSMRTAMLLTAVLACVWLAYRSYSRDAVRSGKEAREKLDCRYLGEILHENKYKTLRSMIRHQKTGLLISNPISTFQFVETMRKITHRVEQHMGDGKVLLVTSLQENEGKTTVAANLALTMAKRHGRVLFLEGDLRKPAGCTILEKKWIGTGVRDVLSGKTEAEDAVIYDRSNGLYMLLERKAVRNSADLTGSDAMQRLIQWAREQYDYVIIDLPPMSMSMDAESVMECADASLLVLRQNGAEVPAIQRAIATLEKGRAKFLGCVLNNSYSSILSSGRGYDGYGKYGKYGRYAKYGHYGNQASQESGS